MQTTGNLGLKKPEGTDIVDIADLNGNMDILDNAVNGKVDKVTGKQLSTNDYTAAEKTKLAGVATGATNYTHPATHPAAIIVQDASNRFVTDAEKTTWNAKETPAGAAAKADAAVAAAKTDYIRQPGYAATSGTATAYSAVLAPAPTTIPDGFGITIVPHVTNGASPTLSVNGLAAAPLKDQKGVAYATGKLIAGKPYTFRRVGTDFLADSASGSGNAVAGDIRAGKTAATDAGDITGTLPVQAGGTVTPGATAVVKPAGIYDEAITVAAVTVPADKVLAGTTIAGTAGTIPIKANGTASALAAPSGSTGLSVGVPVGAYLDTSGFGGQSPFVNIDDPDFIAANFRADKNIFGKQGSIPVITVGGDPAIGVARWPDGALAVYPSEGYRKGGAGAGELKVSTAQLKLADSALAPQNIMNGISIFGVGGTLQPRLFASGTINAVGDGTVTVTGLSFTPVIAAVDYGPGGNSQAIGMTMDGRTIRGYYNGGGNVIMPYWDILPGGFRLGYGFNSGTPFKWWAWG
ncbi:hypothetical protein BSK65_19590 [Paenibacillus odorifer]|uniref:Uncharacterized protein n=1 Tax=Paenibacillus odorifer TaxID=189426 RepID=A0A1R0ZDR3_9BACL|nr:hypothetical protein [Paenibacillus odorifer]OME67734.1 hypothetical protein BSK65_19590 [Paenibacillus odorifer]